MAFLLRLSIIAKQRSDVLQVSIAEADRQRARTQAILTTVLDGVLTVSDQGVIITANPAAARMFSTEIETLQGQEYRTLLADLYEHSTVPLTAEEIDQMLGQSVEQVTQINGRRANGEVFPMETLVGSMVIGGELKFVITLRDVTDRLSALRALRASDMLNHTVLSSANHMVLATTSDGTLSVFNTAAERLLQERAQDVIGKRNIMSWLSRPESGELSDTKSAQLAETGPELFSRVVASVKPGEIYEAEWEIIRGDGQVFPASVSISPLHGDAGDATGYVAIIDDITVKKAQQEALRESEETFRSALQFASIGMALVSPDGRWMKVNSALTNILGYSEEELLATDFQSISHPDDLDEDIRLTELALAGGVDSFQMEKRFLRKDGSPIWTLLSTALVRNAVGEPQYFVSQISDISEQKEIDRIKSEFISTVSHELRTPLTSIRGALGLVVGTMKASIPEAGIRLLTIAQQNSERLIILINDILDIDKIASGKMKFELRETAVHPLLVEAVVSNQSFADKYDVELVINATDQGCSFQIDDQRFIQVITNLISNAAKFSSAHSKVLIDALYARDKVTISVTDFGRGISPEFQNRIFGKFTQEDSSGSRAVSGTGLGLHITKQLVEQMHGRIGFESTLGKGTTFWVEFDLNKPFAPSSDLDVEVRPGAEKRRGRSADIVDVEAGAPDGLSDRSSKPNILHIEDNEGFSEFLAALTKDVANLITVSTPAEAQAVLKTTEIAAIASEIELRSEKCEEFLTTIHTHNGGRIPIVLISSSEPSGQLAKIAARLFIKSTVRESEILAALTDILSKRSSFVAESRERDVG